MWNLLGGDVMLYLTVAMIVIWLLAFGYVFYLVRRTDEVEQEIRALEDLMQELERK